MIAIEVDKDVALAAFEKLRQMWRLGFLEETIMTVTGLLNDSVSRRRYEEALEEARAIDQGEGRKLIVN